MLDKFQTRHNGMKPQRLLFYRDGASEGQFKEILEKEVRAIKEACQQLEQGYAPPITCASSVCGRSDPADVVCAKRHHTRFFVSNPSHADRSGNCRAGLVVDEGVTHRASQCALRC